MLRSKAGVFVILGLLIVMTGVFTASSASDGESAVANDRFILVNGDEVSESEFTSRVATVEQNILMLTAQAEMVGDDDPLVATLLQIMDETPAATIALASLILDVSVYQEAIEQGHQPDAEVIEEQVTQERTMFEAIEEDPEQFGVDQEDITSYRENIDEIGEEQYWAEFYPQMIEQQTTVQQFQAATSQDGAEWIEVQQDVLHSADVDIHDPDAVAPATAADARDYLDTVWDLTVEMNSGS